jgi:hypothetical protein
MEKHVTIVAALQIGWSILGLVFGLFLLILLGTLGTISGDEEALVILPLIGVLLGGTLIILSALGILGGFGLLKYRNWARILILVLSALDLLNFPLGTALAVYTVWVLVQGETAQLFGQQPVQPKAAS